MNTLLNLNEASAYVGKSPQILRRLVRDNILPAQRGGNNMLLFEPRDLDTLKATAYPLGMSHSDISAEYGIKRTSVIYHFQRLKVKPIGYNRGGNHRTVYDEAIVRKFAKVLGWDRQPGHPAQNQTNGS